MMTSEVVPPRVAIVVPTLGERPEYLASCLESIRRASVSPVYILVVIPEDRMIKGLDADGVVADPRRGLSGAINAGFRALPEEINFINWLGDDDQLRPGSLDIAIEALNKKDVNFVFGMCDYIDENSKILFTSRSGVWASKLMKWGPQLLPQPGALFARDLYQKVGELDENLRWAFDLDLFLRFAKVTKPRYVPEKLAAFRWHGDSLSVGQRRGSVVEASMVRRRYMPKPLRGLSVLWEPIVREVIFRIGQLVSARYVR